MSYIVEYTTLSGKRIPITHKIFETAEAAEAHGRQGVAEGNYRAYAVVEAAPKLKGDSIKAQREKDREHADAMGRHVKSGRKKSYTSTQRSLAKMRGEELPEAFGNPEPTPSKGGYPANLDSLQAVKRQIEAGRMDLVDALINSMIGRLMHDNNTSESVDEGYKTLLKSPKEVDTWVNTEFGGDIKAALYHANEMANISRDTAWMPIINYLDKKTKKNEPDKEGNASSFLKAKKAEKEKEKVNEGYKTLPNIDRDRYSERPGLEGPFQTMAGKVVYYDPKEGAYYDPDTDMYMSYDEFRALDNDYSGMKDERDIPVKEAKGLASIDWPDADKYGSEMAKHAENAIRHGMHAYDAYSHVYSMTLERDWMRAHKDELIKMFASYGLATESIKEAMTLDYSRYMRSHGKKPRVTGPGLFMFTTKDMGEPAEDDVFQFQGNFADAKRAAAKWAKSKGAYRFYMMENDDDRDELTKKLFPRRSREEMEKADRERNRAYNQKRFMEPSKPSRSREWGAYEGVTEAESGTYMKQWYDYSEDYAMLELYVDGELVDKWDGYFGANETGNPLQAKFIQIAKANGVDPVGLKVIDGEDGDEGVFTSSGLKWNSNEEVSEAAAKIACVKCDEVSTAKAWEKNRGFCPKCKTSNQGVAESINEATKVEIPKSRYLTLLKMHGPKKVERTPKGEMQYRGAEHVAHNKDTDTSITQTYSHPDHSIATIEKHTHNPTGKVTYYMRKKQTNESVNEDIGQDAHHMERDHEVQMARSDLYKTANYAIKLHSILKGISEEQGLEGWMQAKITKAADYLGSVFHALEYDQLERSQSEPMPAIESVNETTSAGAVASVPMPMGKMIKRKKK